MKQLKDMESPRKKMRDMKATSLTGGSGLTERVAATIDKYGMVRGGETVLVGLSGGADSICLLTILSRLREKYGLAVHAVYVNHNLRPEETPKEIEFCEDFCRKMG